MTPTEPPKNAMGTNTAESTSAMPTSAPVIWPMDLMVASLGERPSSAMMRSTFSTTTMASSTSRPMASTTPNMVSVLIEKPNAASTPKVPSKTSAMASTRVLTTSSMESRTNGVVSNGYFTSTPAGKNGDNSARRARTAVMVSSALAPEASLMVKAAHGLPLK